MVEFKDSAFRKVDTTVNRLKALKFRQNFVDF
jgi:hypothetical protein